jgi:hypothetical protein
MVMAGTSSLVADQLGRSTEPMISLLGGGDDALVRVSWSIIAKYHSCNSYIYIYFKYYPEDHSEEMSSYSYIQYS